MPEPSAAAEKRVQEALKQTIETNLARERAISEVVDRFPGAAFFSNGIIFSKSGNGTPFSNGIFFSKTGRSEFTAVDPQVEIVGQLATFDAVAFNAFTERLLRLKQVKAEGPSSAAH